MDSDTEKTAKPRRRGLRFSLRTLLIVVTVLAVPLGWVGWELGQVRKERPTITWVEETGGQVFFNYLDGKSSWEILTELWFGWRVGYVFFDSTEVSDLSPLAELKNLEELYLHNTQVSDLSPLAELQNLKLLSLRNTQVSDEQVQELRQALPNCVIITE